MRNKKGFTIVEMVVVISIISILAAVTVPTFSNIIEISKESTDLTTIRQACSELTQLVIIDEEIPKKFYFDKKNNCIKTCVKCKGTKTGWQKKGSEMSGSGMVIYESVCYAADTKKPYLSIKIDKSTGKFTFTRQANSSKHMYN